MCHRFVVLNPLDSGNAAADANHQERRHTGNPGQTQGNTLSGAVTTHAHSPAWQNRGRRTRKSYTLKCSSWGHRAAAGWALPWHTCSRDADLRFLLSPRLQGVMVQACLVQLLGGPREGRRRFGSVVAVPLAVIESLVTDGAPTVREKDVWIKTRHRLGIVV